MKANRYYYVLTLVLIAISLMACGHHEKPIDKALLDKMLKVGALSYFDLSGNWIPPNNVKYFDQNEKFKYCGRTDLPKEAIDAGITNVSVELEYLVSPDGNVLYVTSLHSKQLGKNYTEAIGYGIEEKAKSFYKIGTQLTQLNQGENFKPSYLLAQRTIHFGDYKVWLAVEENAKERKIAISNDTTYFSEQTDSLDVFFDENMIYPKSEISKNISGIVEVSFYVTPDYKLLEPKIEKGINSVFDNEAMRLLNLLAKNTESVKFNILKKLVAEKLSKNKSNNQWTKEDYFKVYTTIVFNLDKIKRTV